MTVTRGKAAYSRMAASSVFQMRGEHQSGNALIDLKYGVLPRDADNARVLADVVEDHHFATVKDGQLGALPGCVRERGEDVVDLALEVEPT